MKQSATTKAALPEVSIQGFIEQVERDHFRTDEDTGTNPCALLVWNLVREYAGLPWLKTSDLPTYCKGCDWYHVAGTACDPARVAKALAQLERPA